MNVSTIAVKRFETGSKNNEAISFKEYASYAFILKRFFFYFIATSVIIED